MKTLTILLLCLTMAFSSAYAQDPYLKFDFTTVNLEGHTRSPRHVFAVWIKDANGQYVNSLMVYAATRIGYLSAWSANSGGFKGDAVTAATQKSHTSHSATWNLKNVVGNAVPDGEYTINFEMSSGDKNGKPNAMYSFPFTVGGANGFSLSQDAQTNLVNIQLEYFNGVNTSTAPEVETKRSVNIYPNPANALSQIKVEGFEDGLYNFTVYDLTGKTVHKSLLDVSGGADIIELSEVLNNRNNGMYILQIQRGDQITTKSFIYKNQL